MANIARPPTSGVTVVIIEKRRGSGFVGHIADRFELALLHDDRLVRRAPERHLAELVAFAVGGAAEHAQGDGGGAELDDVVGADDGRLGDRPAVDDDRVGRRCDRGPAG